MTYAVKGSGGGAIIHTFADIKTEMPGNGIKVSPHGFTSILIDGATACSVEVRVTFDTRDLIDTNAATYVVLQTVTISGGVGSKIDMLVAPTGIILATTTANVKAWVMT